MLLFDFDGTLAEFDLDPAAPRLTPERRARLERLARRADRSLGLVSGRRLDDLRRRTGLPAGVYHAGLHGLEIEVDGRRWQHPDLSDARRDIRGLAVRLSGLARLVPGIRVEDKGASVAVHVRGVERDRRLEALALAGREATPWVEAGLVRPLGGAAVVEYMPNIQSHKGDAVRSIAADVEARVGRSPWVVFVGDDLTDEDGFRAITSGIGVLVGLRPTAATHQLDGIRDVDSLLSWLAPGT